MPANSTKRWRRQRVYSIEVGAMGGHYGSIHIRTEDANEVRAVLEELARERNMKFLLAPAIDGWVTAFPSDHGQDFSVAEALAAKVKAPFLHCLVHDDDVFAYQFFEGGVLADQYNSCPDYFGGSPEPRGGNALVLVQSLAPDGPVSKLQNLLNDARYDFEVERFEKFSAWLGLPNAVTAYEYLQTGERYNIKRWRQFIHIPDLTGQKAQRRTAKAKARADMKQLLKAGVLRFEQVGAKTSHRLFPSSPVWCVDPSSGDVLLAWTGNPVELANTTTVNRLNTKTGSPEPTGIGVSSHVNCMAASPNGRWLAAGCAYGDWMVQIWDRATAALATEWPQSRAVERVAFSKDGQTLFSLSEQEVTVLGGADLKTVEVIELTEYGRAMAIHPQGEHLVVDSQGMLTIVHIPTRAVVKTVWIDAQPSVERAILERLAPRASTEFLEVLTSHLSAEELEHERERLRRHFLPKQNVFTTIFSSDGNLLICGTGEGVCVLDWRTVLDSPDMSPLKPNTFVETEEPDSDEKGSASGVRLVYSVIYDSVRHRVLFAGLEGKVRFLELADGRTGDLLVPPMRLPFWRLELAPDRTSLVGTATKIAARKPETQRFQIWNYPALCRTAGIPF